MKILSINTKLTKDLSNVAFNVDSPIDENVLKEFNYKNLLITKNNLCIFFQGSGKDRSIKNDDVLAVESKYNLIKQSLNEKLDQESRDHLSILKLISLSTEIPIGE